MENNEIAQIAKEYEEATNIFLTAFEKLAPADLDSEAQSYARLKRLIAEPGSVIQGYDENIWAQNPTLGYTQLPIENSLALFKASRAASLEIINRLTVEQLANAGVHTESGAYDVRKWLKSYINHPKDHAKQLLAD
jgi:hypothetical protein